MLHWFGLSRWVFIDQSQMVKNKNVEPIKISPTIKWNKAKGKIKLSQVVKARQVHTCADDTQWGGQACVHLTKAQIHNTTSIS